MPKAPIEYESTFTTGGAPAGYKPKKTGNAADRASTEAYASPFSTAFGGTAPSTELDAARQYASPFSTAFGGTAPTFQSDLDTETNKPGTGQGGSVVDNYKAGITQKPTGPSSEMSDAFQRLYDEFNAIGLGALVQDAKNELMKATSIAAMPDALRNTETYKQRFSANDARIKAGLKALSPAAYLNMEDKYQEVMRQYGLPASYYTPGQYGKQEGFEKLLANDVSNTELEDRIITAQQRVLNSNPEVLKAIKDFYGDSVTNGDILAYALDPSKAIQDIKKKVTAAEIQSAANVFGLNQITKESTPAQIKALEARAAALAGQGVDKEAALAGFETVSDITPRGSQLAEIYKESPYTQGTAEAEVFKTAGAAEAKAKRKRLAGKETASFSGSSGVGALGRDRATNYGTTQSGFGQY